MTYDIDLVVPTTVAALAEMDAVLNELGLRCRLPITLSDLEQLRTFASLSPARRLQWLEEMRELTFEMAPAETRASWRRLRK